MSAANTRRLKIFSLLRRLGQSNAMSIREIYLYMKDLGFNYSQKTIERDLDALTLERGIVATESYPKKFYATGDFNFKQELVLDFSVIETIHIALQNLRETSHDYFDEQIKRAEVAFEETLSTELSDHLLGVKHKYHFDYGLTGKPVHSNSRNIKLILSALREEKTFSCYNASPYKDDTELKHLAPLYFVLSSGMPYLIAKDLADDSVSFKRFRLTRLSKVKLGGVFDILEYQIPYESIESIGGWSGEPKEIRIHANAKLGTFFLEKVLHPTQKVEKLNSDEYLISFTAPLSNELKRILAGFGGDIYHVAPLELEEGISTIWNEGFKNKEA